MAKFTLEEHLKRMQAIRDKAEGVNAPKPSLERLKEVARQKRRR